MLTHDLCSELQTIEFLQSGGTTAYSRQQYCSANAQIARMVCSRTF